MCATYIFNVLSKKEKIVEVVSVNAKICCHVLNCDEGESRIRDYKCVSRSSTWKHFQLNGDEMREIRMDLLSAVRIF